MKILWQAAAFDNARRNIPAISTLTIARDELLPRVHPQTYKAFLKAAFELGAEHLEIASGWRPMLGSVLHRIGVGLDVTSITVGGTESAFSRSATPAEQEYKNLMAEKKILTKKNKRTTGESTRLNEITAVEAVKASTADKAIYDNETSTIRTFVAKLRANGDVRQTFDPWEMDANTGDRVSAAPNRLVSDNESLHRTHLHITVKDSELGY